MVFGLFIGYRRTFRGRDLARTLLDLLKAGVWQKAQPRTD